MRWMRLYAHFQHGYFDRLAIIKHEHQAHLMEDRVFLLEVPDYVVCTHNPSINKILLRWREGDNGTGRANIISVPDNNPNASNPKYSIMLRYKDEQYPIEYVQERMHFIAHPIKENPELAKAMGFQYISPFWMLP